MVDASLSQDEIDALLSGVDNLNVDVEDGRKSDTKENKTKQNVDLNQFNSLLGNISSSQSSSLSSISNKDIDIKVGTSYISSLKDVTSQKQGEMVIVKIPYLTPSNSNVYYLLPKKDSLKIVNLISNDSDNLDDMSLHTISEAISQMVESSNSSINSEKGINLSHSEITTSIGIAPDKLNIPDGQYVVIDMSLNLEQTDSQILQLYPVSFVSDIYTELDKPREDLDNLDSLLNDGSNAEEMNIKSPEFSPLKPSGLSNDSNKNMDLLLDIPMNVTVELGRCTKTIHEILSLGEGSIIELDKLAGESVDLLVNGKPIAKGEVVVIDENFGIRITDIVSPKARLMSTQS